MNGWELWLQKLWYNCGYNSSIIIQLIVTIGYNSGSTIAVVTTYPYAIPTKAIQVEVLGSRWETTALGRKKTHMFPSYRIPQYESPMGFDLRFFFRDGNLYFAIKELV